MTARVRQVVEKVSSRVSPKSEDYTEMRKVLRKVSARIRKEAEARGLKIKVEAVGSIAKDTWIRSDKDIDIFIIFADGTEKEKAKEQGLEVAKAASGSSWRLGYAEHPYVEAEVDGYTLDIVPSVMMKEGEKPLTSVDRTPLHTTFINKNLDSMLKKDVRVLKQFMKGIGVYGAELKVGGFSGYLCELLILNYSGFEKAVKAISEWGEKTAIDYSKHYKGKAGEVFDTQLVVIDPVDRRRNAAAAVSQKSYSNLIVAAKFFLKKPSTEFFFPSPKHLGFNAISKSLEARGASVIGVVLGCPPLASDVLWGELNRSLLRIVGLLEESGFRVNESATWSDEKKTVIFFVEVLGRTIGPARIHEGPKVTFSAEAERFVGKYVKDRRVLAGPYVKDGRWCVELRREERDAKNLLEKHFAKLKLSKDIEAEAKKGFKVLAEKELYDLLKGREGLLQIFLLKFVEKRPRWLS
ncbi:MAG: CCA tRNA nucleotidyltransferase [Candidatus Methanomethylicaceae archaeon]|jgi:tRNA nucleotidyltransferase (CCA-adding enzyme)